MLKGMHMDKDKDKEDRGGVIKAAKAGEIKVGRVDRDGATREGKGKVGEEIIIAGEILVINLKEGLEEIMVDSVEIKEDKELIIRIIMITQIITLQIHTKVHQIFTIMDPISTLQARCQNPLLRTNQNN